MAKEPKKVPPIESEKDPSELASAQLSAHANADQPKTSDSVAEQPLPALSVDLNKLSPDQLYQLKEQLDGLAPRTQQATGKPKILLRQYNGQIIIDFGQAFNTWVRDERANQNIETVMIPIKLLNTTEFVNVSWREFMNLPQIECEVISRKSEQKEEVVGVPIRNRDNGQFVPNVVKRLKETFLVKLPVGTEPETVELEARIVNG